ncbi:MAG TPA: hypothetical protein VGC89_05410 [Pyrinomonadaceae bacterium]|jgi:hypothetical protein
MAEDTTLATARATDAEGDEEITKAELQRRMEQARETITQTVTEIKDTVTNQYQTVKETIHETLDWREQFRKRPVAFSVGALSAGFIVGYSLAGAFKGSGDDRDDYPGYEESDVWNVGAPLAPAVSTGRRGRKQSASSERSYAAQAITGGSYGSTEYNAESQTDDADTATSGESQSAEEEQPSGPGLLERFKETKAFDRLQGEVSKLGDRFIDQLSTVGQEVVLPALFGKIKELFGVDLSGQQQQGSEGTGRARAAAAGASSSSTASPTQGGASDMGGLSYGTSENRGYGSDASRDDYGRSSGGSSGGAASDTNRGPQ